MVITDYSVKNKLRRVLFLLETFLFVNISLELVLAMSFLILSKADVLFANQKFVISTYTATEALPTTRMMETIDKSKFAAAALNVDNETFVVHIADLAEPNTISIYNFC